MGLCTWILSFPRNLKSCFSCAAQTAPQQFLYRTKLVLHLSLVTTQIAYCISGILNLHMLSGRNPLKQPRSVITPLAVEQVLVISNLLPISLDLAGAQGHLVHHGIHQECLSLLQDLSVQLVNHFIPNLPMSRPFLYKELFQLFFSLTELVEMECFEEFLEQFQTGPLR